MNNMANNEIGLEKVPTFTCPSGAIPSVEGCENQSIAFQNTNERI